jgi:pyrroloquinoline quinone biosynthesis protein E
MSDVLHAPLGLLAELTHRCPLACPYCSNPIALEGKDTELTTAEWADAFRQAAAMGVLQVSLSGGEPGARRDLEDIVTAAREAGLYVNLITSGIGIDTARLGRLKQCGVEHVQISLQDVEPESADTIAGYRGAHVRKIALARDVVANDMALTINAVIHRANIARLGAMVDLAVSLGAGRVEVAHTQYYGWALKNRAALMPTRAQLDVAMAELAERQTDTSGALVIDFVVPDYYARRPKACLGGWGRKSLNISPSGRVLPCHAAETIPGLEFWSVRDHALAEIWVRSPAFTAFRGTAWMPEPCRSCDKREEDWGGCRCQALAVAGNAAVTDPACDLSPHHAAMVALAEAESAGPIAYVYRGREPARATAV